MKWPMQRIQFAQRLLKDYQIDILYTENTVDIFYLTGIELSLGKLYITSKKAYLVVDGRYYESAKNIKGISLILLGTKTYLSFLKKLLKKKPMKIGFDGASISVEDFKKFKSLLKPLASVAFKSCPQPFSPLRAIKSKQEIKALKKAAQLGCKGFDFVLSSLKEGISELELVKQLEIFWLEQGAQGLAFEPIIAFGKNASMPHYKPSKSKLRASQQVLIDIGVKSGDYHSDMTRVVFFKQKPKKKLFEIYQIVKEAQALALKACKSGVKAKDLDLIARDYISSHGYGPYFNHSLGHGIGLQVHEFPSLNAQSLVTLQEGMVITIEPGIYLPSLGGVRIEDTVVVGKDKCINFTPRSKELWVVG